MGHWRRGAGAGISRTASGKVKMDELEKKLKEEVAEFCASGTKAREFMLYQRMGEVMVQLAEVKDAMNLPVIVQQ